MKIGDRVFVHGYVDEIRKDTVIIRNNGGYFGTIPKVMQMTNEQAIEELDAYRNFWKMNTLARACTESVGWQMIEALDMAIEALEGKDTNVPSSCSESPNRSDLISRQDTIEAIDKHIDTFDAIDTNYLCGLRTAMSFLKEMPSAQPEKKVVAEIKVDTDEIMEQLEESGMVEVVRCKDCIWYLKDGSCARHLKQFEPYDYCSYAERKDNG